MMLVLLVMRNVSGSRYERNVPISMLMEMGGGWESG